MSLHYYTYTFIYFNGLMPNTKKYIQCMKEQSIVTLS
jgi:hypothetical protein